MGNTNNPGGGNTPAVDLIPSGGDENRSGMGDRQEYKGRENGAGGGVNEVGRQAGWHPMRAW